MIKFEPLTPEKLIGLQPYFSLRPTDCAESHFAYHLLWRPYYETKYYADEKGLVWLQKIDYDEQATMVPVCGLGHMRENFDRLQAYFTAIGVKMHMYLVDEAALGAIRPDPERYEVLEDRDSFDYIYSGEEMRVLPGRKYSKMKNRISRFRRDYGETAEFVILNPEDEGEIRTFLERWSKNKESDDDLNRLDESLNTLVPDNPNKSYDMMTLIQSLADNGKVLEYQKQFAPNILTCLIRMGGRSVGVIASQPKVMAGCLDINASDKASRFIRTCDSFNIPLLTLEDVPGFLPGSNQEHGGIIRHGAKMLYAYSEATVPKITVITRKAYGGAYIGMCSKHLGADMVLAWPDAEIAVMGASGACNIIFSKEIKNAEDPQAKRQEKIDDYQEAMMNPYVAAARGYVDDVIMPEQTRQRVISTLFALEGKQDPRPRKKHGNIPL